MASDPRGLLIDLTRCAGCGECVAACRREHGAPFGIDESAALSASTYTSVRRVDGLWVRDLCRHCVEPACTYVCPGGALHQSEFGIVVYDSERCLGCRDCMVACPFGVPRYEWNATVPSLRKCDGCIDRLRRGDDPACAAACPHGATAAGTRSALLEEARRRLREEPSRYLAHVYGEREVGGTSVLFLAPRAVEALGYEAVLGERALPELTWTVLRRIPAFVVGGGAVLWAIWWFTRRRDEVAAAEAAAERARRARVRSSTAHRKEESDVA